MSAPTDDASDGITSAQSSAQEVHRTEPGTEDELIDWLIRRTARRGGRWIGDDAAVLPRGDWAVTMDSQIEGVHFQPGLDAGVMARRLLAVNLSDLAAMGASPAFAFLALAAPRGFDHRSFFSALTEACEPFGLQLAGGDLARHSQVSAVLTLLGAKAGNRWLRRSDARPGEDVWLGGTVGEAALGLALLERGAVASGDSIHLPDRRGISEDLEQAARRAVWRQLSPDPQLELGKWLACRSNGAAIDLSDGLSRDLHRLCSASRVGATIYLDRLPLADGHRRLALSLGRDWKELALAGGEDYVLLFTLQRDEKPPEQWGCRKIGAISESRVDLVADGQKRSLSAAGWDHLRS